MTTLPPSILPVPPTPIVEDVEEDTGRRLIAEAESKRDIREDNIWNMYNATSVPKDFNVEEYDMRHHLYLLESEHSPRKDCFNPDYEAIGLPPGETLRGVEGYEDLFDTRLFEDCRMRLEEMNAQRMNIEDVKGSKCIKCGKNAVVAVLKQLRSADEGATEVRTCMKCGAHQ